jgi:RNA polymerase sigma factor (TIGR02999 family)
MSETALNTGAVVELLDRVAQGDGVAAEQLLPAVYDELRHLAAARLAREAPGHTLQATALVHEAWLRLGADRQPKWQGRAHFFAAAAEAMRRILIDHARRRRAWRHGGAAERVDLEPEEISGPADTDELLAVHDALDRLAAVDGRKAEVVKLRYFVGLTEPEIALALGVSEPTVKRDWAYARAWLFRETGLRRR